MPASPTHMHRIVGKAVTHGLPMGPTIEPKLALALRHTLENPGSLVRAILAYQLALAFEMPCKQAESLAVGVEYMHTASLLFDDMPAMDDAQERRSHACAHVVYGEAACTLAALALINRGYALLWQAMATGSERQATAAQQIEHCLGLHGMLTGQSSDLHRHTAWTAPDILRVSMGKTVALIRLTLVLPALLGNASDDHIRRLHQLGVYWGLSYQILDDLKDVFLQPELTGKTNHRDATLGRPNLALADGVSKCLYRVGRLLRLSESIVSDLVGANARLLFLLKTQRRLDSELARFQVLPLSACA